LPISFQLVSWSFRIITRYYNLLYPNHFFITTKFVSRFFIPSTCILFNFLNTLFNLYLTCILNLYSTIFHKKFNTITPVTPFVPYLSSLILCPMFLIPFPLFHLFGNCRKDGTRQSKKPTAKPKFKQRT
jgi:hypothetical protein